MKRRIVVVAIALVAIAVMASRWSTREDAAANSARRASAPARTDQARTERHDGAPVAPALARVSLGAPRIEVGEGVPRTEVSVTVIGLDGAPRAGASVELRGVDSRHATTTTGIATFAAVAPGRYQIVAWAEGTAKVRQWLQVHGGEAGARLALVRGAAASGRVIDEHGGGVVGAVVVASRAPATSAGDRARDATTTGPEGSFRFDALPAGEFQLRASHPTLASATAPTVTLDGKTARADIEIAMAPGATLRGRVVDRARGPVAGARVRVSSAAGELLRDAVVDPDGTFVARGLANQELSAIAVHDRGASKPLAIDAIRGDPAAIELVIDQLGAISGTVVDGDGTPLGSIRVAAFPRDGGRPVRAVTDASGRFTLAGLADGDYRITAGRRHRPLVAHTGRTDLEIVLWPTDGTR
jgi:hypothetical protein